jgi:hypothetical protein
MIAEQCRSETAPVRTFPGNKAFAFTIFDDTDHSTLENTAPVYRLLLDLGIRTTKSVWPLASEPSARIGGASLQEKSYLDFIRWLQSQNVEIALHNVRNHDSTRAEIRRGLDEFKDLLGCRIRIHCNHSMNRESLYWGERRLENSVLRLGYNIATKFSRRRYFQGHVESSPYFWGDFCKQEIQYVRNFVFDEINLDRVNPTMPYYDPSKPFVNSWFSSSEGDTVESFCKMLREENQDRLAAENGVCIMYTHFGKGFYRSGAVNPDFARLMRRLVKMNGWFVPVSTLLDHLQGDRRVPTIPPSELRRMELRWFLTKLRNGAS